MFNRIQQDMMKLTRILHVILTFIVLIFKQECFVESIVCSGDWKTYKDHCYLFHTAAPPLRPSSWSDATLQCQLMGSDLISIGDQAEQTFINEYFKDPVLRKYNYWIGFNDIGSEGNFTWSDGTQSNYTNWRTSRGEPNNWRNNENCAEVTWDGLWNDNNCDVEFGFVCEKTNDSAVAPATFPPYPSGTDKPTTCEAGWIPWRTSCYGIINGIPKTWKDARADCLRRFGELVVMNDQQENDFITNELQGSTTEYWIGLSDKNSPNRFAWVDGTLFNDTMAKNNWRPGEPSSSFGNEDCVEMYGHWLPGKWNDNHCNTLRNYICEKESGTHNCPDGWLSHNGYCYQINAHPNQKLSFSDARKLCQSFNQPWKKFIDVAKADLVSITSQQEHDFLDGKFYNYGIKANNDYYWIGLQKDSDNDFHWTDGSKFVFQDWINTVASNESCAKSAAFSTEKNSWRHASCDEKNYFVCKVKRGQDRCYDPVGVQDFRIPDSSFSASSQHFMTTPPRAARLYLKDQQGGLDGAWCPANNATNPWLQIDFGKPEKLTYMSFQGKANTDAIVTSFYLKYSMDGVTWETYGDIPPNMYYKFKISRAWRKHKETVMSLPLPSPLKARYIRIYPFRAECYIACCMRVEFYGCPQDETTQECGEGWTKDEKSKNCYMFSNRLTTWDSAESICTTQGGHLTSIVTKQERDYLNTQLKPLSGRVKEYWIGLNDLEGESMYSWSDLSPIRTTNWRSYYLRSNALKNCVAVRSSDGTWNDEDCTEFRNFICKKSYDNPYVPKKSFNGYWPSSADYFWKMNALVKDSIVRGTTLAKAYGVFTKSNFNGRDYLSFDGSTNYVNISASPSSCISHPGSNTCPHGISAVFNFKYTEGPSSRKKYVIDTLGSGTDTVGFYIYIRNGRINVLLRDNDFYYFSSDAFDAKNFNHFAFTWSSHDGLKTFVNGIAKSKVYGSRNQIVLRREEVTNVFIGRSATAPNEFTKIQFGSLAFFERVLSPSKVYNLYLAEFGKCGQDQLAFGSHCYEFNTMEKNWQDASTTCQARGGHLASVHSSVEQSFITLTAGQKGLNMEMWIGLAATSWELSWTDETSVTYTKWLKGEPSGRRSTSCVHTVRTGAWNNRYCFSKKGFICKYRMGVGTQQIAGPVEQNITVSSYVSASFGCPFPKHVQIDSATYGNAKENCYADPTAIKNAIQKNCGNHSCRVQSTDYFFGQKDPCPARYIRKETFVKYRCVKGTAPKVTCSGDGYALSYDGMACYKLHLTEVTRDEAVTKCQNEGAQLTSITSQIEQVALTSLFVNMPTSRDVWVGMTYDNITQTYAWMDQLPVTYTSWFNKYPDPRVGPYVKIGVGSGLREMFWFPAAKSEKHSHICKKYPGSMPIPTAATTQAPKRDECPEGWWSYGNFCYHYNNETMSFVEASRYCSSKFYQSSLVSIMDSGENQNISLSFYLKSAVNTKVSWIGLTNQAITSGFKWTDGRPVQYINWLSGRPYSGNRHFCAGMNNNGFWEDLPCYSRFTSMCKLFKGDLPPPTTQPPSTTTQDPSLCPTQEWKYVNGSCYYFSRYPSSKKDYHSALLDCQSKNSSLASVLDADENKFIYDEKIRRYGKWQRMMIGLEDFSSQSGWQWSDGSIVKYLNFAKNEPSNSKNMESCVEMWPDGYWNDHSCNVKMYYVCKWHKDKQVQPTKTLPQDSGYCEDGWLLYGKNCYLFNTKDGDERQFNDARGYCKDQGGELASIHSSYENAFVMSQLYKSQSTLYIGLTDEFIQRTFLWTDESTVDYTNWYSRQPGHYSVEDCVEMYPFENYRGRWNDINCQKNNAFVCKKRSQSTKPTGVMRPTSDPGYTCPDGFKRYHGSCYFFSADKMTRDEAVATCQSKSASKLTSIISHYEQAYVFSHFVGYGNVSWIGLSRDKLERSFSWMDGSKFDYSFWKNQNTPQASNTSRQCFVQEMSKFSTGDWVLSDCDEKRVFTCKIVKQNVSHGGFIGECPEGWEKFKGKCYKYFNDNTNKVTWSVASERCVSFGGNLVTIANSDVQRKMEHLVRDGTATAIWTGLNDRAKPFLFTWSSGVPFSEASYSNWNKNEPNNNFGNENCVEMYSTTGRWNDLFCGRTLPFICEHSLECRSPVGLESGKLPDASLNGSSFVGNYYPKYARLNAKLNDKDMAWCTNITNTPQTLTVNLGQFQHITRINTQGLLDGREKRYVISYGLEYSKDGKTWKDYVTRGSYGSTSKLLVGNTNADKIEGVSLDVQAQYLRFTPVLFHSDSICMRMEIYGCQSVCLQPLSSMASVTIDSRALSHPPTPLFSPGLSIKDSAFIYQLTFLSRVKLTRIEVRSNNTFIYNLHYADAEGKMIPYMIASGTKMFKTSIEVYDLELPVQTHKIVIKAINSVTAFINVEMFGCVHDCDTPFGLASKVTFANDLITAKTQQKTAPAYEARLNTGSFNANSWCALKNDKYQYLQVDFTKTAQITGIATQGFYGDVEKYVTSFYVQWSLDGDLWQQLPEELPGNTDGLTTSMSTFDAPIYGRFLRIVPSKYQKGICMRIEVYGCPLSVPGGGGDDGNKGKSLGSDSSGLSEGGKIGLIVFFLLLILVVIAIGGIYYYRRRSTGFDVPHKSFENPVHIDMTNDEIDIINYSV